MTVQGEISKFQLSTANRFAQLQCILRVVLTYLWRPAVKGLKVGERREPYRRRVQRAAAAGSFQAIRRSSPDCCRSCRSVRSSAAGRRPSRAVPAGSRSPVPAACRGPCRGSWCDSCRPTTNARSWERPRGRSRITTLERAADNPKYNPNEVLFHKKKYFNVGCCKCVL